MSAACREFRAALSHALSARAGLGVPAPVAWHEHLLACTECRELLEAEEALEALLASLPEPRLPAALAQRVLRRLAAARAAEVELDRLLDSLPPDPAPAGLPQRVLARLESARAAEEAERRLDLLLARVPAPAPPIGLAERVLAALESERAVPSVSDAKPRTARRAWPYALAAAIAVALGAVAWLRSLDRGAPPREGEIVDAPPFSPSGEIARGEPPAPLEESPRAETRVDLARSEPDEPAREEPTPLDEPPADLLASLDLLESWDVLASGDLDLELGSLDGFDEVLLDLEAELAENGNGAHDAPTKG